ncbi:helix-turn-helix domain-containing protein [Selenihalanaerobacter shriftii]|uniref:Transcriptional regulator, XRE family with cupin sensor n=1 Tax=Selenihalanaerobacter shriftii TaxID=142842 RepID=A0A1T4MQP1_9FIRM|nr:helix-turn-helix domain-containing protein [Selenihalanaerobacter shriftii]SJZ69283.1 transcriptional regulator, XRE family with cupin sensor [Selenihalanaerobacter shriftii]
MIGKKIRDIRKKKGLSLKDLAEKTEFSSSYISQLERDLIDPSINSLRKIADALGVRSFQLLMTEHDTGSVVSKEERDIASFPHNNLIYEIMFLDPTKKMGIMYGKLKSGKANADELLPHKGEEAIIVDKGELCIEHPDQDYYLKEGDSIYYDSTVPHRLVNKGNEECCFYVSIVPPIYNI